VEEKRYPPGIKVMVRSNNDEPLMIGTLLRYEIHPSGTAMPFVKDEKGKTWVCMSIVLPYNKDVVKNIEGKTPKDQWEYFVYLKHGGGHYMFKNKQLTSWYKKVERRDVI